MASIPVIRRMAELIAHTPPTQPTFIVNKRGATYKHENYLEDAVSQ